MARQTDGLGSIPRASTLDMSSNQITGLLSLLQPEDWIVESSWLLTLVLSLWVFWYSGFTQCLQKPTLPNSNSIWDMYFHSKMAWPPATCHVISRNHSNWPSLNLSQNVPEGWTNSYWKRQVLMFYPATFHSANSFRLLPSPSRFLFSEGKNTL